MRKFIKNLTVTIISSSLLIGGFGLCASAYTIQTSEESTSAAIQQQILDDCHKNKLEKQILENEKKIRFRESEVRSEFDHKLSKLIRSKEQVEKKLGEIFSWLRQNKLNKELNRINDKISKVKKKISKNEARIQELKQIREYYDYKLADALQKKSAQKQTISDRFRNI